MQLNLTKLLKKAEKVVIESAKLTGDHNIFFIDAIRDLLRITNSYYSNRIELEGTHPIDIERAMKQEFSLDTKKRDLQKLSLILIEIQKQLEEKSANDSEFGLKIFSLDTIKNIHHDFYNKDEMSYALNIKHGELSKTMVPGELRKCHVEVGEHVAANPDDLISNFNEFETLYNECRHSSQTMKLVYVICSHHRLVYIHPFLDGNGRISRLYLDYLFQRIHLEGYGLWNLSRGTLLEIKKSIFLH